MAILEYDTFLSELTRMFNRAKTTGSVSITMKRYDGRTKPTPRQKKPSASKKTKQLTSSQSNQASSTGSSSGSSSAVEYHCLIRAKLHKKKISTVVHAKDVNKFHMAYVTVLKGNMDSLKKRLDKKERAGIKGSSSSSTTTTDKKTRATQ